MSTNRTEFVIIGLVTTHAELCKLFSTENFYESHENFIDAKVGSPLGVYSGSGSEVYIGMPLLVSEQYDGFNDVLCLDIYELTDRMAKARETFTTFGIDLPIKLIVATIWS